MNLCKLDVDKKLFFGFFGFFLQIRENLPIKKVKTWTSQTYVPYWTNNFRWCIIILAQ